MNGSVFRHNHRVTYADCTAGNHVYYGRYLTFLEACRGALFHHCGKSFLAWQEQEYIFPVIECHIRYKAPARYDEVLATETWLNQLRGTRLNFGYRIADQKDRLILEAETLHVCAGLNEKPRRLPKELIDQLQPFLREAESPSD